MKESYFDENSFDDKEVNDLLDKTICKHDYSATILLKLPAESYFFASTLSVKCLTKNGYEGVYVSFQRPFNNIYNLFEKYEIDTNKVSIIECAKSENSKGTSNINSINISNFDVKNLGEIIVNSLKKIRNEKKFIYIDSLTTIALYKKTSDIKKLIKILIDIINSKDFDNTLIIFNVAQDLCQKKFVKDISSCADAVVNVLNYTKKYSREVIKPGVCT